jgi:molybdate transport system substrate-binding protein
VGRIGIAIALVLVVACDADDDAPLRIWAAASLTESITDVAEAFRERDGGAVSTSFDASNRLARQLEHGAPADVFISADAEWMDWAIERDLVESDTRRIIATNRLVIVVGRSSPVRLETLADLGDPDIARIGLAGENVPAGRYADAALAASGVDGDVRERVVRGGSVRATLAWAASGEVDAAIVYRTDAAVEPRVRIALEIDAAVHPPIEYPAAVVTGSTNSERARRFVDFCASAEARALFDRAGLGAPVTEGRRAGSSGG